MDASHAAAVDAWTLAIVATAEALGREDLLPDISLQIRHQRALAGAYDMVEKLLFGTASGDVHPALGAVAAAWPASAPLIADSYERVLDHRAIYCQGLFTLESTDGQRKPSGSYFTPPYLVRILIEHTLIPVLTQRLLRSAFGNDGIDPMRAPPLANWDADQRNCAQAALLETTVCDPACGPGNFLLAALEVLTERLLLLRHPEGNVSESEYAAAHFDVAAHCIYGIDRDPQTIAVARIALWLAAGSPAIPPSEFAQHFHAADSLGIDSRLVETRPIGLLSSGPLDWRAEFPEVFSRGGFDVVLGNPPFANAIEGSVSAVVKEQLASLFPGLRGTADLSYYFLDLAHRLTKPDGAVGLVLPRGVLTGRSVRSLRKLLQVERPPCLIYAPQNQYLFPGANVFVVLLALRRNSHCLASRDPTEPRLYPVSVASDNWWAPILEETKPGEKSQEEGLGRGAQPLDTHSRFQASPRVGDRFEVFASMTTGMAYDLLGFVSDQPEEDALRLVTTGLIDPGICHWGQRTCRYLKNKFASPYVHERDAMHPSIKTRLAKVRRPKILVAGLSTRVEAFLDAEGEYCGAVSTFTIVDPKDDLSTLRQLLSSLNAPPATDALHRELGAHAMGGGRITLSKQFLMQLPLPW